MVELLKIVYRFAFLFKLIFFNNLVSISGPPVPVGPPVTEEQSTTPGSAASQAVDLETDHVGTDLDGMKALFNATLSE
jgi:hypothetical protein